jgi:ribosomal protein S18 acetylase RimI-like enzyme
VTAAAGPAPGGALVVVRALAAGDRDWARSVHREVWGSELVARKGEVVSTDGLPGFVAQLAGARAGLAVVAPRGAEYEVVSMYAQVAHQGIGRALLAACVADARRLRCRRLWLTTTNDNLRALAFYQRFGLDLCALYVDGVERSRRLKPGIPRVGANGIRVAHELELELLL